MSTASTTPATAVGAYIVGDEILSGRRTDQHLSKLIGMLSARGLRLSWASYLGDDTPRLVEAFRDSLARGDVVFSFGGIGATPDDLTRAAVAEALGRPLELHPQAEALIRERFGGDTTHHRLQMGFFPQGAEIIPNPYNQIPGFAVRHHYFVPGFPVMAWPMIEWVLDERLAHLHHGEDYVERAILLTEVTEGDLIELMERITAEYPQLALFSLPSVATATTPRLLELGVKGAAAPVQVAMAEICGFVTQCGYRWQDKG